MNIRNSSTFNYVMYFKFFMVVFIWGLIPLLIPEELISIFGFQLNGWQLTLFRTWGVIVLLDTFLYVYIFRHRHNWLTKNLLIFSIIDNAGIGLGLLILTLLFSLPWGVWINIPFQLFFGYWFWKFYKAGEFRLKAESAAPSGYTP